MGLLDETVLLSSDKEPELRKQFPKLYGALGGLLGTSPDQFERFGSVLDAAASSRNSDVQAGASLGFIPGLSLNFTPAIGAALATKGSGFKQVPQMLETLLKGYEATGEIPKLAKVPLASLTPEEMALYNSGRVGNEPRLASGILSWNGRHQFKSRGAQPPVGNGYPLEELQAQLDNLTSQNLKLSKDNLGRPSLQATTPRTNYAGKQVSDNMVISVDSNGKGEVFSVIPEGDGLGKGKKAPAVPFKSGDRPRD